MKKRISALIEGFSIDFQPVIFGKRQKKKNKSKNKKKSDRVYNKL
ncbi:hypothetical protein [Ileibacterium valens]